jgi:hypothetical protein
MAHWRRRATKGDAPARHRRDDELHECPRHGPRRVDHRGSPRGPGRLLRARDHDPARSRDLRDRSSRSASCARIRRRATWTRRRRPWRRWTTVASPRAATRSTSCAWWTCGSDPSSAALVERGDFRTRRRPRRGCASMTATVPGTPQPSLRLRRDAARDLSARFIGLGSHLQFTTYVRRIPTVNGCGHGSGAS